MKTKENCQMIFNKLDSSQGVIEIKAFEVLNETDMLANMLTEAKEVLDSVTAESTVEDKDRALLVMKEYIALLQKQVYVANDASHVLEETIELQRETIDNIQYVIDLVFDAD